MSSSSFVRKWLNQAPREFKLDTPNSAGNPRILSAVTSVRQRTIGCKWTLTKRGHMWEVDGAGLRLHVLLSKDW